MDIEFLFSYAHFPFNEHNSSLKHDIANSSMVTALYDLHFSLSPSLTKMSGFRTV